jgi:hypothetical protein
MSLCVVRTSEKLTDGWDVSVCQARKNPGRQGPVARHDLVEYARHGIAPFLLSLGGRNVGVSLPCSETKNKEETSGQRHFLSTLPCKRHASLPLSATARAERMPGSTTDEWNAPSMRLPSPAGRVTPAPLSILNSPRARVGQLGVCNLEFFPTGVVVSSTMPGLGAKSHL